MQSVGFSLRNSTCRLLTNNQLAVRISQTEFRTATRRSMSSSGESPIYSAEYLSSKLQKELKAEHVDIEDLSNCGCGMKFDAVIVSPQFEGKPILQRQRLVNQTLAEEMKHIHAFTMRTLTPGQWKDTTSKKA